MGKWKIQDVHDKMESNEVIRMSRNQHKGEFFCGSKELNLEFRIPGTEEHVVIKEKTAPVRCYDNGS